MAVAFEESGVWQAVLFVPFWLDILYGILMKSLWSYFDVSNSRSDRSARMELLVLFRYRVKGS